MLGAYLEENKNHLERHLLKIRLLYVPPGKQRLFFSGQVVGSGLFLPIWKAQRNLGAQNSWLIFLNISISGP